MDKDKNKINIEEKIIKKFVTPIILSLALLLILFPSIILMTKKIRINNETNELLNTIENDLDALDEQRDHLSNDRILKETILDPNQELLEKSYEKLYKASNELKADVLFYLINSEGLILASNDNNVDTLSKKESYFNNSTLLADIQENPNLGITKRIRKHKTNNSNSIRFAKAIKNNKFIGAILLELPKEPFESLKRTNNTFIITDNNDYSIDQSEGMDLKSNKKITETEKKNLAKENDFIFETVNSEKHFFKVVSFMSVQSLYRLVIVEIIFFILFLIFSFVLINQILKNEIDNEIRVINNILVALQKFQDNNMDYRINYIGNEKSDKIIENYNSILNEIENLIKKNNKISELHRLSEIKQLQSQFNPHFIFNVLETLKYIISEDVEQGHNMINDLAKLLRYSIDYEDSSLGLLKKDLEYIKYYLNLQKERFEDRLEIEFNIEKGVGKYSIPKLIIQPLIENSIKHGFGDKINLKIWINIYTEKDILIIEIVDDGEGFSQKQLNQFEKLKTNEKLINKQIGIINTYRRLKLHYDDKANFTLENIMDKSVAKIKIEKSDFNV